MKQLETEFSKILPYQLRASGTSKVLLHHCTITICMYHTFFLRYVNCFLKFYDLGFYKPGKHYYVAAGAYRP